MDRNAILNYSKVFYLEHKIDQSFINLFNEFCIKKGHPEHLQPLIQAINIPMIGQEIIVKILEEYEKEFKIIKLIDLKTNKILNIY